MQLPWALVYLGACVAATDSPTASIDAGVIVGTTTTYFPSSSTTVNKFLGVPFAAPPERFALARKPEPWTTPRDTKEPSAACVQQFSYPESYRNVSIEFLNNPAPPESEDCLYLNVYAPASPTPGKGRAVLFWIYGGGFWLGHAAHPSYDGSHFAAFEDVIVVAANYRTNVFGFPNAPSQRRNLGLLDQRLALDWVQRNIHAFGGDPAKVTIFGESAGSFSVEAHITSFPSNSTVPFRAAIMQSGQLSYRVSPYPGNSYSDGALAWAALVKGINCTGEDEFECVKHAPASTIKDYAERQSLHFSPVSDNETLVADLAARRRAGNIARVPLLIGNNADEGTVMAGLFVTNMTAYLEDTLGSHLTPGLLSDIRRVYRLDTSSAYEAASAIETDISMQCGTALVANDTAAIGVPTWRYWYNATFPSTKFLPNLGVYHTSEIPLVFSTYPIAAQANVTATTQQNMLTGLMRGAWARFAKDPVGGPGLWNAIGTGGSFLDGALDKDVAVISEEGVRVRRQSDLDERCSIWSQVLRS